MATHASAEKIIDVANEMLRILQMEFTTPADAGEVVILLTRALISSYSEERRAESMEAILDLIRRGVAADADLEQQRPRLH